MSVLEGLRNLFLWPRIANCCACHSKDITVQSWESEDAYFAQVTCDHCGRNKTVYTDSSEDDAIKYAISKWNDECNFWNYHDRVAKHPSKRYR